MDEENEEPMDEEPEEIAFMIPMGQPLSPEDIQKIKDRNQMKFEAQEREFLTFLESLDKGQMETLSKTIHMLYHNPDEVTAYVLGKISIVRMMRFQSVDSLMDGPSD